ncbi:carbohydrate ABC transporter permease [Actinophytocola algeriensis]|uniref:Multiple sugar transport system permease protein n=1 Tax=Actinophytocola algeriensis TaxID=1768010 RepID=A0A7W7Q937_9PSEU|nr:sugar ABC transporter permease [Actinophytocola algeriensis]MBB4909295.1 multiple sugar transport system permease protein [Actinophytocola algeriensis]MBE1475285.1 multiple sugar transport system permease protein [Actinophytocola algeriensis]
MRRKRMTDHPVAGALFVLPFFLVVVAFLVVPLGYAFWLSLSSRSLALGERFTGFDNYVRAFSDPVLLDGFLRVVVFGAVQIPVMLGIALAGALTLDAVTTRFAIAFRLIAFMPYAVPAVLGALMWGFLYSRTFGPFADLPTVVGGEPFDFFSTDLLLLSLGNIVTWAWTGYNMIVLYSALQAVPREMYEAALLDGATQVQIALRVKVPVIRQAIALAAIFTVIGTMQFFVEPYVMARFAPQISAGYTPNLYAYNQAFAYSDFHYSAAISFALGFVVFVAAYAFVLLTRKRRQS